MWVNGINVLEELLAMFCLLDDEGDIYIPELKPGWIGSSADGLGFKLFHEQVGYYWTNGGTHGCTMNLFKILTLENEICIFEPNLHQCNDVLGDRGPVVK